METTGETQIIELDMYGKTVHTFVYSGDTKKRYVHIFYSVAKAAGERARLEESIQEMQSYLPRFQDTEHEFGSAFHKYFHMHYMSRLSRYFRRATENPNLILM